MLFPSIVFLFCFFPIMLGIYFVGCNLFVPSKYRITAKNITLLIGSVIFYAYGEGKLVLLLLLSILLNWLFALLIDCNLYHNKALAKLFLIADLLVNIGIFFIFKYLDFFITNINRAIKTNLTTTGLTIPLGISFFTFQALSYVIDVYKRKIPVQKNPLKLGLYISLFPQLIAGPIVRYETIEHEINERKESLSDFSDGVWRFVIGLSKKVLLADALVIIYNRAILSMSAGTLLISQAWLGAFCYTLHIYFDFSGYSDMAIGLGKMFGFHFNENFNYPYISGSITQFWRRWHISLSSWFRDYVYIPLGGSRCSAFRYIINVFVVWTLTGLWHGAAWNFVLWGMLQFVMLLIEKYIIKPESRKVIVASLYRIITLIVILLSWTLFGAASVSDAAMYIKCMFGMTGAGFGLSLATSVISNNIVVLILGTICATPLLRKVSKNGLVQTVLTPLLFLICIIYIIRGGFSPFIYFNF